MFILRMIENEKKKNRRKKNIKLAKNIGTGLTIGAAMGVLLAPKSGEETRDDIKYKTKEFSNNIKDTIDNKKENINEFKNTLSNIKSDIIERASQGISPIENYEDTEETIEEYIEINIVEDKE